MKKKNKKRDAAKYVIPGAVGLFILMCIAAAIDYRYTPLVFAVFAVCFIAVMVFVLRDLYNLYTPRFCPQCNARLRLPLFPKVSKETVKATCRICGYAEDTEVVLPETSGLLDE